ncbi:hypothetical protein BGZ95_006605 [Linnemannia exigua]|uniref:Uncharacterized protein n=1 Tax=Linnemannia exigua TaxID=604196 RepID=A0AAD4DFV2_9FUNG|nr:hypothetical protein BGZ95_006605 [Linnemannia exigua]
MSDSPPPPPQPLAPMFQQTIQGILARNVANNHITVPVHYHQPTGTRYIPMSVLHQVYPGIIRLQVDGQEIQPRRGLPTVQTMFEGVLSQWVDEASLVSYEEGEEEESGGFVGDLSTPEVENGSAQSPYVLFRQEGDGSVAVGGGSQGSHVSTSNFFPNNSVNPALLSQPESRALSDEGASEDNIEWIEYRPDSIVQVVYCTPGPTTETTTDGSSQRPGAGTSQNSADFPPSFWERIRQEIRAAMQQYHRELIEEVQVQAQAQVQAQVEAQDQTQAPAQGGNDKNNPSPCSSSYIEIKHSANRVRSPFADSIISVSSSASAPSPPPDDTQESRPVNTKEGKDRKRDRDEDDNEDSSPSLFGSEKRLKASPASPNGGDEEEDDEETDSQESPKPESSGFGSGSGSDSGSDPSYRPGSGSSSSSNSGSDSRGSPYGSSSGSGASSSNRSCSSSALGSGAGSSSKGPSEASSGTGSSSLVLSAASSSETTLETLETSPSAPLEGAETPAAHSPSDELIEEDVMMIRSEEGANKPENNTNDRDSAKDSDNDEYIDDDNHIDGEEDDTQPFRFTDNQLRDFVARRKGLLVRETQAVTIALKSNKEARQFCKFLASQDYFGRWLNIRLTWNWDRDELGVLVQALTDSPIETLFLDGCCDHAAAATSTATVPGTRQRVLTLPSSSPRLGHQTMDNRTRTRRYDPLIRLFRNNRFRELHFYGLPNLLQHSMAPVPWVLSHVHSFHLHANIDSWEDFQANRFLQFVKRATNLEHLRVDCPTDQYHIYTDNIERALNQTERNKHSPPLNIHFQHHQRRHTLLRVKYDPWDREVKEFEVDLIGAYSESNIAWSLVLEQFVDGALVSVAFNNMPDERWMGIMMNWVNTHMHKRSLGLRNLVLDCMHFGPTQFHDLIELLMLIQPRLQTLDLRNVYISFPSRSNSASPATIRSTTMLGRDQDLANDAAASVPMITWPTLIKSLNFSVLVSLRIKISNLQDRDIDDFVKCLRTMAFGSKKLNLEKLLLQGAQLSVHGEKTLVKEVEAFMPSVDVKFR